MIIIGEKINGSIPVVAEAIKNRDAEFIKNRAKIQAESGATYIDCCASVPEAEEVETLKWMIEQIQEVTDLPIAVIHIDPLVEMLCTSEDGIAMNVEVISTIRKEYPTIHITAAVSNISFNLPVRKLINLGFTVLAMNAGLDSAILDPTNRDMLGLIYATEALLGEDEYCIEYIGAYREGLIGPKK